MNKRIEKNHRYTVKGARPSFRTNDGKGTCPRCGGYAALHRCSCGNFVACGECWDQLYNQCPSCSRSF